MLSFNTNFFSRSHTTAKKVSIEREHFKAIQVSDLTKLSADKVFQRMQEAIN